jgi:hypothetical protein
MWKTIRRAFDIKYMPMPPPFERIRELNKSGERPLEETDPRYQMAVKNLLKLINSRFENKFTHLP